MIACNFHVTGVAPYSQSRPIQTPKKSGETDDDHDSRVWREHLHVDDRGIVFIPPMALKSCLSEAAKFKSEKIRGKGNATYTKHFEVGTMFADPVSLGIKADNVESERLFLNSDGVRGSGKRVWKTYPVIPQWDGDVTFYLLDEVLIQDTDKVLEYLEYSGLVIGIGRFRARNGGYYGRFEVSNWTVREA